MIGHYSKALVNKFALLVAWSSVILLSAQQYLVQYQFIDSIIFFSFGLFYIVPTLLYRRHRDSGAIKYWIVFGTVLYIQIIMYIQNGLFDNTFYLCICIVATAVFFNARLTILTTLYLVSSCSVLYIFFKPQFFPIFRLENFLALLIAFVIIGLTLSLQTVWSKQLVQNQAVLFERASRDKLTNLYNRTYYDDTFNQLNETFRTTSVPFSLILIDIDNFKMINDKFGHITGDKVIIEIADRIRASCRKTDTVTRFGGEEFTVLLGGVLLPEAQHIAEKIRQSVNDQEIENIRCSVSVGVTQIHPFERDHILFNRADTALYRAKNNGKNRVEVEI